MMLSFSSALLTVSLMASMVMRGISGVIRAMQKGVVIDLESLCLIYTLNSWKGTVLLAHRVLMKIRLQHSTDASCCPTRRASLLHMGAIEPPEIVSARVTNFRPVVYPSYFMSCDYIVKLAVWPVA